MEAAETATEDSGIECARLMRPASPHCAPPSQPLWEDTAIRPPDGAPQRATASGAAFQHGRCEEQGDEATSAEHPRTEIAAVAGASPPLWRDDTPRLGSPSRATPLKRGLAHSLPAGCPLYQEGSKGCVLIPEALISPPSLRGVSEPRERTTRQSPQARESCRRQIPNRPQVL